MLLKLLDSCSQRRNIDTDEVSYAWTAEPFFSPIEREVICFGIEIDPRVISDG